MAVADRLNVSADQRRLRCLTDSQAAPQTHAVWLWFELGQRGRSLLAVLWQNKEINMWKGYWYMSRQGPIRYHYYQIFYIDIRHGPILLNIFPSAFVFLSLLFLTILNFTSCSFSFILYWVWVLYNSNTDLNSCHNFYWSTFLWPFLREPTPFPPHPAPLVLVFTAALRSRTHRRAL